MAAAEGGVVGRFFSIVDCALFCRFVEVLFVYPVRDYGCGSADCVG